MKYLIEKDKKRRKLFEKKELNWLLYRSLLHNQFISFSFRKYLYESFFKLPLNSSRFRLKNRCIITGRSGSIYRKFKFSRHIFREFSLNGRICGIKKAVW